MTVISNAMKILVQLHLSGEKYYVGTYTIYDKKIFLTDEGKRRKEISRQTVLGFNEKMRSILPEKDLEAFFRVMETVNQNIVRT